MNKYIIIDPENNSTYTDSIDNVPDGCRVFEYDSESGNYIEIEK